MEITWTAGPSISIGGTPLSAISTTFSQGQKWLLHFATTAYSELTLRDPIVLCLDEPELHLHPAALNQILDILRARLENGQILIATHSIPVIAHVGYENTWFVSKGSVSYAGRNPEKILEGLAGGIEGVRRLSNLLTEPTIAAISRFALESVLPPTVSAARPGDPQGSQILTRLRSKREELGRSIRVLDYGAGKARILDIADFEIGAQLVSLLDYYAFEPSPENRKICESSVSRIYGVADGRVFGQASSIPEMLSGSHVDIVILCNVVHEISPSDWIRDFKFIGGLLTDAGEILIVEDLQLPHGEHAHKDGFVIASKEALRIMFQIEANEALLMREVRSAHSDTPDRLMCLSVPAKFVNRISAESVRRALTYLRDHASRKIQEIRDSGDGSFKAGVSHALYLHQFANSTFALARFD
jgi:hypothetical protein